MLATVWTSCEFLAPGEVFASNDHELLYCGYADSGMFASYREAILECHPTVPYPAPGTGNIVCPPGTVTDSNGECACGEGQADLGGLQCVPCPEGTTVTSDGTSCSCDNGGVENPGATDGNYCPCASGEMEIGGTCQVPVECRADQERTNENTCACPSGETPPWSPPAKSVAPEEILYDGVSGSAWGVTVMYEDVDSIECALLCDGRYRLVGDIVVTDKSYIGIRSSLWPRRHESRLCRSIERTEYWKGYTRRHEDVHANKFLAVINRYKSQLGQEFDSEDSEERCNLARAELVKSFRDERREEARDQANHTDHGGWIIHEEYCLVDPEIIPTPMQELPCGVIENCRGGNTY